MPRRRVHGEGTYAHYVTFSCYKRRRLLGPDACKRVVIGTLGGQLARRNGICCGFVVMPDHVHAVLRFPRQGEISPFMDKWKELSSKRIAALYAKRFPSYRAKLGPNDPVWQARYYGFNVFTPDKLREKVDYMHRNPVRAGLAANPCEWPWSSARFWAKGKPVGIPLSWPP